MKSVFSMVLAAVVLGTAVYATAQSKGPHDAAIKGRQAMFQTYNFNMGILSAMAKGKTEYNADTASEAAKNLLAAASFGQSSMWPPGSDNETEGNAKNRALPAIWETYPAIVEKGEAMQKAATVMADQAGQGLDALKGAMGDLGGSCKGCHDDFRAKRR